MKVSDYFLNAEKVETLRKWFVEQENDFEITPSELDLTWFAIINHDPLTSLELSSCGGQSEISVLSDYDLDVVAPGINALYQLLTGEKSAQNFYFRQSSNSLELEIKTEYRKHVCDLSTLVRAISAKFSDEIQHILNVTKFESEISGSLRPEPKNSVYYQVIAIITRKTQPVKETAK